MYFRFSNHLFLHISVPILLLFSIPAGRIYQFTLISAVFHECCHASLAYIFRVPILRLTILPYGCHLRLGITNFSTEAKIAAAGPLGSLFLFLVFSKSAFGQVNLILFLFNLIPVLPLDGGRLLRLFFLKHFGTFFVNRILRRTGIIVGVFLLLFGVLWPSVFCLIIALLVFSNARQTTAPSPIIQKKTACGHQEKMFSAKATDSLLTLTHYFSPFYHSAFFVADEKRVVTERSIIQHLRQNVTGTVGDLLSALSDNYKE